MKNLLKRYISILACMAVMISTMSMYTFAATAYVVYVGGYSMDVTNGETINCGTGTAVYDSGAKTLTLTDATIDTSYSSNYSAIYANTDIEIILVGENTIISDGVSNIKRGIYVYGDLKLSGTGTLDVTVANASSTSAGIYVNGDLYIDDVTLNLNDVNASLYRKGSAIVCYANDGVFEITNATIKADGFKTGVLESYWTALEATNSTIIGTGDYLQTGIATNGGETASTKLVGCTVDFTVSICEDWNYATGITTAGTSIILDKTKFTFNSELEYSTGLYSYDGNDWSGTIDVINGSEVEINIVNDNSYSSAIFAGDYINIDNSKVTVKSNSNAIYSDNSSVTIANGSEVYAESLVSTPITGNWGDVNIIDSKLTAIGRDMMAIDVSYKLNIKNSEVVAKTVEEVAIMNSSGTIVIENSKVTAESEKYLGFYSYLGAVDIIGNDSVVTATAGEGYAAFSAFEKSSDTENTPEGLIKITMDDPSYIDIIEGALKVSVYGQTSSTFKGYMTSFVADDQTELAFDRSNALQTVTIKIKDADYTAVNNAIDAANALTAKDYVDFTAVQAAIDAVVVGHTMAYQDDVDAMATAILDAIDNLELVPDDKDSDIPDAGNNSNIMVFIVLLALSACTSTYVISRKKA